MGQLFNFSPENLTITNILLGKFILREDENPQFAIPYSFLYKIPFLAIPAKFLGRLQAFFVDITGDLFSGLDTAVNIIGSTVNDIIETVNEFVIFPPLLAAFKAGHILPLFSRVTFRHIRKNIGGKQRKVGIIFEHFNDKNALLSSETHRTSLPYIPDLFPDQLVKLGQNIVHAGLVLFVFIPIVVFAIRFIPIIISLIRSIIGVVT